MRYNILLAPLSGSAFVGGVELGARIGGNVGKPEVVENYSQRRL